MRQRRTIYFNDARHYYLFVHEPPMRLEDAWAPVDEVADTGVDTFVYGVSRDDGWFYPSQVGLRFGQDMVDHFDMSAYWRVWHNMQSLIDRQLDPLQVLIDRAHKRGMDFIPSLRMGAFAGLDKQLFVGEGGPGMGDVSVRDFMLRAVDELATGYDTQGVELDFAAAPGGTGHWFPPDKAAALGPEMTDWLRRASDAVHNRAQDQGLLGARVYPTAAANHKAGLEVERWLEEGLVDYLVPMVYGFMIIDGAMPIDWLIELAHDHDSSVYAMLQPYYEGNHRPGAPQTHASPAMFRAAAANAWQAGVDGLYTWFLAWPLGESERAVLTELSDPAQVAEKDKHYFLRRTCDLSYVVDVDYPAHLPLTMDPAQDLGRGFEVPVVIADDIAGNDRIARICLRLALTDLTCADRLDVQVNGQSLEEERMQRRPSGAIVPYEGMWLEYDLVGAHPLRQGLNRLQLTLQERPPGLCSKVVLEDVEVIVEYGQWA